MPPLPDAVHLLDRGLLMTEPLTRALDPLEADAIAPVLAGREVVTAYKDLIGRLDAVDRPSWLGDLTVLSTPLQLATAAITAKHRALGAAGGFLGGTMTAVTVCPDGVGYYRHFQGGSIYWHPMTGAHEVRGLIREHWASLGWERSALGYPTTDELVGRDPEAAGRVSHFTGGSLYWYPAPRVLPQLLEQMTTGQAIGPTATAALAFEKATGDGTAAAGPAASSKILSSAVRDAVSVSAAGTATGRVRDAVVTGTPGPTPPRARQVFEVHGAIRARYLALGGEASVLGYPTTDETATPDAVGRYNHFQRGSIYWTPGTGAHEVHGLIRALWAAGGWERNPALGYPVSDELVPDRRVGSARPETHRKPVAGLPVDIVKVPAEGIFAGLPREVVNIDKDELRLIALPASALAASTPVSAFGTLAVSASLSDLMSSSGALSSAGVPVRSTPAPVRSPHRYGDFENGVLFWSRGATKAQALQPWRTGPNSTSGATVTAAAVVAAGRERIATALAGTVLSVTGASLAGTTAYVHDGSGSTNRRHRVLVTMRSAEGGQHTAQCEVRLLVGFEPLARTVSLSVVGWNATAGVGPAADRALHTRLDPLLWQPQEVLDLAAAAPGEPVAVLSVKTLPTGDVAVYREPTGRLIDLADAVHLHVHDQLTVAEAERRPVVPGRLISGAQRVPKLGPQH